MRELTCPKLYRNEILPRYRDKESMPDLCRAGPRPEGVG